MALLKRAPNLERLALQGPAPIHLRLTSLRGLRLTHLRSLSLKGLLCRTDEESEILVAILNSHPNLEALYLGLFQRDNFEPYLALQESIPHLKVLHSSTLVVSTGLLRPLPNGKYRTIIECHITDYVRLEDGTLYDVVDLRGIGATLRDLDLEYVQDISWLDLVTQIATACPKLRRLRVDELDDADCSDLVSPIPSF